MTAACDGCLRESVLRSEALRYAEGTFSSTVDAASLLRLDSQELHTRLLRRHPEIESQMADRMEYLLESVTEDFGTVWTVCRHEPEFPARLERLDDPPAVLYGIGDSELLCGLGESEGVAIVGARRASSYGREVAYSLANEASSVGLVSISGMALGVDGAAHRGALRASGRTIAVLAGGPELPYPASHRLLHRQIAESGCVVAENPPGTQAKRWAFVARNRVIAGLSAVSVFVEGSETSGARHTMRFAEQVGAVVGAVPGPVSSPLSEGPNAMLSRDEAVVIRDLSDVLDTLAIDFGNATTSRSAAQSLDGLSAKVHEQISTGSASPREIANNLPDHEMRQIASVLGELEISGLVVRELDGSYRASRT